MNKILAAFTFALFIGWGFGAPNVVSASATHSTEFASVKSDFGKDGGKEKGKKKKSKKKGECTKGKSECCAGKAAADGNATGGDATSSKGAAKAECTKSEESKSCCPHSKK